MDTVAWAADGDAPDGHEDGSDGHADMKMKLHIAADANDDALLVFQATEPGEYVVHCTVEGHRGAGMEAKIIVEP